MDLCQKLSENIKFFGLFEVGGKNAIDRSSVVEMKFNIHDQGHTSASNGQSSAC